MPNKPLRLIRNWRLEADSWKFFDVDSSTSLPPDEDNWIVSLDTWRDKYDLLITRRCRVGVLIPSDADISAGTIGGHGDFHHGVIAFIAIDFPNYTDGRGYSLAQMLRKQHGWHGELRAVGDVLIDTIHYLARCGFDSFLVKEGHEPQQALAALETFTVHYQKSYLKPIKAIVLSL